MAANSAAGCKLYIGGNTAPATFDETGYAALTWTEVGTIEDLGEFGDSYSSVTFESLSDGRTQKFKGTADAGDMSLTVAFDGADTGQVAIKTALDYTGAANYYFKVALNDAITPTTGTPSIFYFGGKVTQRRIQTGSVNNVVKASVQIGICTEIVEVAAT